MNVAQVAERAVTINLIGHVGKVTGIEFLPNTTQFISSSEDGTLRLFDFEQQSQLIYVGESMLDECCALNSEWFVAAGESLFLFSRMKRSPVQKIDVNENSKQENLSFAQKLIQTVSCVFGYGIVATAIFGEVVIYQFDGES